MNEVVDQVSPPYRGAWYLGIDPGANGGFVALPQEGIKGGWWEFRTLPESERDRFELIRCYSPHRYQGPVRVVIEKIQPAIFGIGKGSSAKLYGSYMALRMALVAAGFVEGVHFAAVSGKDWQRGLRIPPRKKDEDNTQWKNRLKREAERRFPLLLPTLRTSDALLIADYCRRRATGQLD